MIGLINKNFNQDDYILGVVDKPVLNESGDWSDFLPKKEIQKDQWGDSFGCVSFSALNCIEILFKFNKDQKNFSDRYTIVKSNTIPKFGNSVKNVAESIRKDGVVLEEDYRFKSNTEEEFYQQIPVEVEKKSFKIPVLWEYVKFYNKDVIKRNEKIADSLKYGPIQACVFAWGEKKGSIYQKNDKNQNHCVTIFSAKKGEYFKVFDHYENDIKFLAWDFNFGACLMFSLDGVVNIAKKYKNKLFKNPTSPKVYYSNGEKIAWIENEEKFKFGNSSGWFGSFSDVIDVIEPVKEDLIF